MVNISSSTLRDLNRLGISVEDWVAREEKFAKLRTHEVKFDGSYVELRAALEATGKSFEITNGPHTGDYPVPLVTGTVLDGLLHFAPNGTGTTHA